MKKKLSKILVGLLVVVCIVEGFFPFIVHTLFQAQHCRQQERLIVLNRLLINIIKDL